MSLSLSLRACASCAFFLVAVFVVAPAYAQGEEPTFRFRLVIDAPAALRDVLKTGLDLARWQDYPAMTQPLLESLVRDAHEQTREAAATEGYFDARVESSIEGAGAERLVRLTLDTGLPTRVAAVAIGFRGNPGTDAQRRVREQWTLPPGEVFRQPAWDAAKRRAVGALASTRYAAARIAASQATIDPAARSAQLSVELDSGPEFGFGPVRVTGLKRYRPETVINLAPFEPGEPYSVEKLEVYARRLNATSYFASAQVTMDPDPALALAAPVHVSVIEAPSQRLDAGIGFSTDAGYKATLGWRDVDIFDSGWRLRSELRLETKRQSLTGGLDLPARDDGWADSFDVEVKRSDIQNLVTRGVVVGATRRRIDERSQPAFGVAYHYEQQEPAGAAPDLARALFARFEYTRRTTDDLMMPRSGAIAALRLGASVPGMSTRTFGRVVGQLAWFHPFSRRDDIALRAEAGAVIAGSASGIPQALLFRTGGDTTVRGYAFESLGVSKGDAIVGGRYYALASAEYTHWFSDVLGGAAFIDAGNAVDRLAGARLAVGYGAGIRMKSPIGPLRLDLALGHDTRELRLHFSVGFTF